MLADTILLNPAVDSTNNSNAVLQGVLLNAVAASGCWSHGALPWCHGAMPCCYGLMVLCLAAMVLCLAAMVSWCFALIS